MSVAHWTVFTIDVTCGSADGAHSIRAGEPVRVGPGCIKRCEIHAHVVVDQAAVDVARHRLEAAALAAEEKRSQPVAAPVRHALRRTLKPAGFVRAGDLFDPKSLAAGDRQP